MCNGALWVSPLHPGPVSLSPDILRLSWEGRRGQGKGTLRECPVLRCGQKWRSPGPLPGKGPLRPAGERLVPGSGLSIHSHSGHSQEKSSLEPFGLHIWSHVVDFVRCRDNWLLCLVASSGPHCADASDFALFPKVSLGCWCGSGARPAELERRGPGEERSGPLRGLGLQTWPG